MTHTLHRLESDIIIQAMAAKGINDKSAGPKLQEYYKILDKYRPPNLGVDTFGTYLTGRSREEMIEAIPEGVKGGVGIAGPFDDVETVERILTDLKDADLGMSVIVTGPREKTFEILKKVGLEPHTVHLSLGIFGKKELLAKESRLKICTMCGHSLVSASKIESLVEQVRKGKITPAMAGKELGKACTCGIYNPVRATVLIKKMAEGEQ